MLHDIKAALNQWRREPCFFIVTLAVLSAAAAANLVAFTLVHSVLLQQLPYSDPDRLVRIWESNPSKGISRSAVSEGNYADWRRDATSFEAVEAFDPVARETLVQFGPGAELVRVAGTTDGFWPMLGVTPLASTGGHGYQMSFGFLQRRFGGIAEGALNTTIIVEGFREFPVPITAVMPQGVDLTPQADLWAPLSFGTDRGARSVNVLARLRPDVTVEQAQAEMNALSDHLARVYPTENVGWRAELVPLRQALVGDVRATLLLLYVAVSLLTLTVAANVAVVFLARRLRRERDVAISVALGATRGRLVRQAFASASTLVGISTALGFVAAATIINALVAMMPFALPRRDEVTVSTPVIGMTILLAMVLTTTIVALSNPWRFPALETLRARHGALGSGRSRRHAVLLTIEIAACSCLLLLTTHSIGTFIDLQQQTLGFVPEHVFALDVQQAISKPGEKVKHYPTQRFLHTATELLELVKDLPDVSVAGIVSHAPMARPVSRATYKVLEHAMYGPMTGALPVSGPDARQAGFETVDTGFFEALRIRFIAGRNFMPTDRLNEQQIDDFDADRGAGAAIVSASFAQRHWAGTSPVGEFLAVDRALYRSVQIVGVVDDVRTTPGTPPVPTIYVPYAQNPIDRFTLLVRGINPGVGVSAVVAGARQRFGDDVTTFNARTYGTIVAGALARPRFTSQTMMVFAGTAVALTALALYSILSFVVALRRRELAIRLALGAAPSRLVRSMVASGLCLSAVGVLIGCGSGVAVAQLFHAVLADFDSPGGAEVFVTATVVLGVACAATYSAVRKIEGLDPLEVLKAE